MTTQKRPTGKAGRKSKKTYWGGRRMNEVWPVLSAQHTEKTDRAKDTRQEFRNKFFAAMFQQGK